MSRPHPSKAVRCGVVGCVGALTCLLAAGACVLVPAAGAAGGGVALVADSTPKPAYTVLIKDVEATPAGKGVTFTQSYGLSGTEATAVVSGLHATVVNFSLEPDMEKLVKAGLVSAS